VPVAFDCECGNRWWSPPDVGCRICGPSATSVPDPVVWSIDRLPGTAVFLSGQLRDGERFARVVAMGITDFVDVAGGAHYVWRPSADEIAAAGVAYVEIAGVEDTNTDLPDFAFERVAEALADAARRGEKALVFCAAGLKRSPHLLYGVLRSRGYEPDAAWATLVTARPCLDPWQPYLDAAERWLADVTPTAARLRRDRRPCTRQR
jgi:hypothetical protein